MAKRGLMQDYAIRNSVLTFIAGFVVGGLLESAGLTDPIPAVAVVATWLAIPAAVLYATVKGM